MGSKSFTKWLKGKMASEDLFQSDVAKWLGITQPALSKKIKQGSFTLLDVKTLFKKLKATDEEILVAMKGE